MEIRHPSRGEYDSVHGLVSQVVNETYGSVWPTTPIQVPEEDWGAGWVAVANGDLMGWMMTRDCWIEDLWVASRYWRKGVGSAFLRVAEREIAARGSGTAYLSVIASNARAVAFYERRGWRRHRDVPHEIVSIPRIEMTKAVDLTAIPHPRR